MFRFWFLAATACCAWSPAKAEPLALGPEFAELREFGANLPGKVGFVESGWGRQDTFATEISELRAAGFSLSGNFSTVVAAADEIYSGGDNARDRRYFERPTGLDFGASLALADIDLAQISAGLSANHSWRDVHSGAPARTTTADFDLTAESALSEQVRVNASVGLGSLYDPGAAAEDPSRKAFRASLRASVGAGIEIVKGWKIGAQMIRFAGLDWLPAGKNWALQAGPTLSYEGEVWSVELNCLPKIAGGVEDVSLGDHQNLLALERNRVRLGLLVRREF